MPSWSAPAQYTWNRTGILPTCGLTGSSRGSRVVIVSCGAATIHVSGGRFPSVVGASDFRHPAAETTRHKQRMAAREGMTPLHRPAILVGSDTTPAESPATDGSCPTPLLHR